MRHPAGCVPSPYLTDHCQQSCHARSGRGGRRCACAVDSCKRLGLPSRARISHGSHHGMPCTRQKNVAGLKPTMVSQRHRSFPEKALTKRVAASQRNNARCVRLGSGGAGRRFLGRCVVEEAPARIEVKPPAAPYWCESLHPLLRLGPIAATITSTTGIRSPASALPFASAAVHIPLLPPAFNPPLASVPIPSLMPLTSTSFPHGTHSSHMEIALSFLDGSGTVPAVLCVPNWSCCDNHMALMG